MDPYLTDAILSKAEYQTVNEMQKDTILQRIITKMQPHYYLTLPGKDPILR